MSWPFKVAIDYGRDHCLRVTGRGNDFIPARTNCLPENATPAEGGDIEVHEVHMQRWRGGKLRKERKLCGDIVEKLKADTTFTTMVENAIVDQQDDGGPDPDAERDDI